MNNFQNQYLLTWTEPDKTARREQIQKMWNPNGRLIVSSLGLTIEGIDNIVEHIGRVHDEMIAAKRLKFVYDQQVEAADALLLRWSMLAPSGEVAGRGVDTVFRDDAGRAQTVYMFMGVN